MHKHAIQSDISKLQRATVKWLAYSRIPMMDTKLLYSYLTNLEKLWGNEALSREEVSKPLLYTRFPVTFQLQISILF